MKRKTLVVHWVLFAALMMPLSAWAANYVKPAVLKQWMESKKPVSIIDIQPADDFAKKHFKEAIETNSFPVKTDEDKKKLDAALSRLQSEKGDIVIVCPRGKSGASNTYDYLKSKGVPENRLFILEGGVAGWPFPEMFATGR